jgi:hypothetical protein
MAEVARQSARLMDVGGEDLYERFKAAHDKVYGAFTRGKGGLESVTDLSTDAKVTALVASLTESLAAVRDVQYGKLEGIYAARAQALGVRTQPITETPEELELDRMVPRKPYNFYSDEYGEASSRLRQFLPQGMALPRLASTEIPWFVNGERSITEIWRLVRAEYGNVTTSSDPWKFAYVVTPETPDVLLADVAAYVRAMEEAGMVEVERR